MGKNLIFISLILSIIIFVLLLRIILGKNKLESYQSDNELKKVDYITGPVSFYELKYTNPNNLEDKKHIYLFGDVHKALDKDKCDEKKNAPFIQDYFYDLIKFYEDKDNWFLNAKPIDFFIEADYVTHGFKRREKVDSYLNRTIEKFIKCFHYIKMDCPENLRFHYSDIRALFPFWDEYNYVLRFTSDTINNFLKDNTDYLKNKDKSDFLKNKELVNFIINLFSKLSESNSYMFFIKNEEARQDLKEKLETFMTFNLEDIKNYSLPTQKIWGYDKDYLFYKLSKQYLNVDKETRDQILKKYLSLIGDIKKNINIDYLVNFINIVINLDYDDNDVLKALEDTGFTIKKDLKDINGIDLYVNLLRDFVNEVNKLHFYTTSIMDLYTTLRMFRKFENANPIQNIIVYAGDAHIQNIFTILKGIKGIEIIKEKSTNYNIVDYNEFQCINIEDVVQPFSQINFFLKFIYFKKLVINRIRK